MMQEGSQEKKRRVLAGHFERFWDGMGKKWIPSARVTASGIGLTIQRKILQVESRQLAPHKPIALVQRPKTRAKPRLS